MFMSPLPIVFVMTVFAPAAEPMDTDREQTVTALIEALKDPDVEVRQNLAFALAALEPVSMKPLIRTLRDASPERRSGAAMAIGLIGPAAAKESVSPLLQALKDPVLDVRRQVSFALSQVLAPPEVSPRSRVRLPSLDLETR